MRVRFPGVGKPHFADWKGAVPRTLTKVDAGPDRLASALAGFDDERLAALLAARPDLADPPPADFARLAGRAWSWPSVYTCYRGLDMWGQQVVQALCLLGAGTTVDRLVALLGGEASPADVDRAVESLADRALLLRDGAVIELAPAFDELPFPAGLGPPARAALGDRTIAQLGVMAKRLGATPGATKTAALDAVVAVLGDPTRVRAVVDAGPAGTTKLVGQLLDEGPLAYVPGVLYGASVSDHGPVGWLLNRGLLVADSWNTAVMPGEVGLALRGGRPFPVLANRRPPLHPVAVGAETVDMAAAEAALRLVADVAAILDDWSAAPPKLLKAGGLGVREVRRAAKATGRSEKDAGRIVDLAAAAGLVVADLMSDSALPTPGYDDWLALDAPARWRELVSGWLGSPLHLGLAGETSTKDKPIPPLLHRAPEPEARRRRRAVLSALASVAPGGAVPPPDLLARLRWDGPLLWSGGPGTAPMMTEWVVEEAELIGLAARRALATTGRLAEGGRVDEAAAALGVHAPPVSSSFVVQADATVVAPGELAAPVRADLELLGDVESKGAATVYRLSEGSLRRGFDAGRTAEEILAFLDAHASRAVPQSLRYLVTDLGRRFGQVRVGAARCYVRSEDPSLLAEVARSRRTARLGLRLLAPTVAVSDAEPQAVLQALRDAGHLPAQEDAAGGLVLVRPERRRASARPLSRRAVPQAAEPVDPASVVARLRRARPPAPAAPPRPTPRSRAAPPATKAAPPPAALFDDAVRPMEIVKDREQVAELLAQAFVEDWAVRIAYTNRKGRSSQLSVVLLGPPTADVFVDVLPRGGERVLALERIEWARAMTEAEEDHLYL
jgi:hypothetical protein